MSVSTSRKYIPWYHAQTCLGATESWCLANSISGDIFIYIFLFTYLAQMTWSNMTKDVERCRKLLITAINTLLPRCIPWNLSNHINPSYQAWKLIFPWFSMAMLEASHRVGHPGIARHTFLQTSQMSQELRDPDLPRRSRQNHTDPRTGRSDVDRYCDHLRWSNCKGRTAV